MKRVKSALERMLWHSSIGMDAFLGQVSDEVTGRAFVASVPNDAKHRKMFVASNELLIHRATKALWKVSADGSSIEPVFDSDVLTEDDLVSQE